MLFTKTSLSFFLSLRMLSISRAATTESFGLVEASSTTLLWISSCRPPKNTMLIMQSCICPMPCPMALFICAWVSPRKVALVGDCVIRLDLVGIDECMLPDCKISAPSCLTSGIGPGSRCTMLVPRTWVCKRPRTPSSPLPWWSFQMKWCGPACCTRTMHPPKCTGRALCTSARCPDRQPRWLPSPTIPPIVVV